MKHGILVLVLSVRRHVLFRLHNDPCAVVSALASTRFQHLLGIDVEVRRIFIDRVNGTLRLALGTTASSDHLAARLPPETLVAVQNDHVSIVGELQVVAAVVVRIHDEDALIEGLHHLPHLRSRFVVLNAAELLVFPCRKVFDR